MEQHVVRSAGRRRIHDLNANAAIGHEPHQVCGGPAQRLAGAQYDDVRIRRQGRFEVVGLQRLGVRYGPVAHDPVGGNDEMAAKPLVADPQAAPLPGADQIDIGGFPGELDRSLRWCAPGDYTSRRNRSGACGLRERV